jgi:hypothetical protein
VTIADWVPFFSGELAAAAERAGVTLAILFGIVIVSTFGLVPDQPPRVFGIELAALGAVLTVFVYTLRAKVAHSDAVRLSPAPTWAREAGYFLTTVPYIAGGALEIAGVPGALYCLAPVVVAAFAIAGLNAWVLLVEITR